jgi:hypothetical protein
MVQVTPGSRTLQAVAENVTLAPGFSPKDPESNEIYGGTPVQVVVVPWVVVCVVVWVVGRGLG